MFIGFLEREERGERETLMWQRNVDQLPPAGTLTGDRTRTLGMCLWPGTNLETFGTRDDAPAHRTPGQGLTGFLLMGGFSPFS